MHTTQNTKNRKIRVSCFSFDSNINFFLLFKYLMRIPPTSTSSAPRRPPPRPCLDALRHISIDEEFFHFSILLFAFPLLFGKKWEFFSIGKGIQHKLFSGADIRLHTTLNAEQKKFRWCEGNRTSERRRPGKIVAGRFLGRFWVVFGPSWAPFRHFKLFLPGQRVFADFEASWLPNELQQTKFHNFQQEKRFS